MWIYQKAKIFMDAGFNAFHMGQTNYWARIDNHSAGKNGLFQGPGGDLEGITRVVDKIRAYADTKQFINYPPGGNAKGIILTHEARGGDLYRDNDPSKDLLFDHNGYPYRGNEIDNCPNNPNASQEQDFNATVSECNGEINTLFELFPSHRVNNTNDTQLPRWHSSIPGGTTTGGTNSRGCTINGITPFAVYMDRGGAIQCGTGITGDTSCVWNSSCLNSTNQWGFDDQLWFRQLGEECKAEWWNYQMKYVRELDNYGRTMFFPAITMIDDSPPYVQSAFNGFWRMTDDANNNEMFNAIQDAWEVRTPEINLGTPINLPFGGPNWNMSIAENSLDNTSIYSWHITKPNGGWVSYTYGNEKNVYLEENGSHTVCVRQDNIGIPSNVDLYGTRTVCTDIYNFNFNFKVKPDDSNFLSLMNKEAVMRPATEEEIRRIEMSTLNQQSESIEDKNPMVETTTSSSSFYSSELEMLVSPNPVFGNFKIDINIPESGELNISLVNTLGQKVMNIANETVLTNGNYIYQGNLTDLPPGAYLVLLELNDKIKTKKVFKQ